MGICSKELLYAFVIMLGAIEFGFISIYPSPTGKAIRIKHGLSEHFKVLI